MEVREDFVIDAPAFTDIDGTIRYVMTREMINKMINDAISKSKLMFELEKGRQSAKGKKAISIDELIERLAL